MIRVDQVRGWIVTQAGRMRPWLILLLERLRALAAAVPLRLRRLAEIAAPGLRSAAGAAAGAAAAAVRWVRRAAAGVASTTAPRVREAAEAAASTAPKVRQAAGAAAEAAASTAPRVRQAAEAAAEAVAPQARRTAAGAPAVASSAVRSAGPALDRWIGAVKYQVEAGRDTRPTPHVLRDRKGRRLRASAFAFGPDGTRASRRRARGGVGQVGGSLLPAAVKVAIVVLVAGFGFLGSSSAYINYAADLPDAHAIKSQPLDEDTLIWAADGTLLADIHPVDEPQHYAEPLDQMGKWLPLATVAIEDSGFWEEPGIDVFAMGRAAWVDWRSKQAVQGASTITQQLVKLRLTGNKPTLDRKVKEAVLAVQVEHTFTKRQILEQYLNAVDYSDNSKGSLAAARVYFHKETKDLDLAQASMLAGIPQSPLYNDPIRHWDQARKRQLAVLNAMVRTHRITQEEADEAYAEDISPPAHMFTPPPQVLAAPAFVNWVVQDVLEPKYGERATLGGGLKVRTTLNMTLQHEAEKAVVDGVNLSRGRNVSQGAMVSIDPRTGAVFAMVGSADPNANGGQYNMAVWPPRNPGSSMKIYNYTAAIESGKYAMSTMIPDTPVTIAGIPPYSPKNYDLKTHGTCQLQECMGNSLNIPAVKVEMTIGVDRVVDMARRMGAPPWTRPFLADGSLGPYTADAPPGSFGPSLTLGGYGETPLQMATGAATLGAAGVYHQPFGITLIQASDGTEIFRADPNKGARQAIDPKVAYVMEQIMSNNDNRTMIFGASSVALTLPGRHVGAKTGTTDDFTDAWTIGYTPSVASAFWFGNPSFAPLTQGSDGIFVAAPAWHEFMQSALDSLREGDEWFPEPPGLGHANVGGKPVWLLPGTSANQPMPPLPPGVSSSAAPKEPPKKPGG
jgi:membrane peptidoglycan carboxypeptidase